MLISEMIVGVFVAVVILSVWFSDDWSE